MRDASNVVHGLTTLSRRIGCLLSCPSRRHAPRLDEPFVQGLAGRIARCTIALLACSPLNSMQFPFPFIFRLHCRFHAEPEPRVMWLCNGAQVFASDHVTLSGNADQSQLTIHGATLLDTGEYVCSASNTLGQATTKTFLRVRSKPGLLLSLINSFQKIFQVTDSARRGLFLRVCVCLSVCHTCEHYKRMNRSEMPFGDRLMWAPPGVYD